MSSTMTKVEMTQFMHRNSGNACLYGIKGVHVAVNVIDTHI